MSEKFSVHSGGGMQSPHASFPSRPSPILFKRDGFLPSNTLTASTRLEDAIRMDRELASKEKEDLTKFFEMLLSFINVRWDFFVSKRFPKKQIQEVKKEPRNENSRLNLIAKIEKRLSSLLKLTRAPLHFVYPFLLGSKERFSKAFSSLSDQFETFSIKTFFLIHRNFEKFIFTPLERASQKIAYPLSKGISFLKKSSQSLLNLLEREGEKSLKKILPPLKRSYQAILKTGEVFQHEAQKVIGSVKQIVVPLAATFPVLSRPQWSQKLSEATLIPPSFKSLSLRGIRSTRLFINRVKKGADSFKESLKQMVLTLLKMFRPIFVELISRLKGWRQELISFLKKVFKILLGFIRLIIKMTLRAPSFFYILLIKALKKVGSLTVWANRLVSKRVAS